MARSIEFPTEEQAQGLTKVPRATRVTEYQNRGK